MLMRRLNGFSGVPGLRNEMDRLFDNVLGTISGEFPFPVIGRRSYPAINVWENDQAFFVEAEVPGLTMNDIELTVVSNELTIKGERRESEQETHFHRRERGVGTFNRVVRLPVAVDSDAVEATQKDGVLTVKLTKAKSALPRRIEVKG